MNICNYCKKEFKSQQTLQCHMTRNKKCILSRGETISTKFTCENCTYIGVTKNDLTKHLQICKIYNLKQKQNDEELRKKLEIKVSELEKTIVNLYQQVEKKDLLIAEQEKMIKDKDIKIKEKDNTIKDLAEKAIVKCGEIKSKIPIRKQTIPKPLRMAVWIKYIGKNVGSYKCPCCQLNDISQMDFECGHVIAESLGGSVDIENLRPICKTCNKSMGTMNMDEFKQKYFPTS